MPNHQTSTPIAKSIKIVQKRCQKQEAWVGVDALSSTSQSESMPNQWASINIDAKSKNISKIISSHRSQVNEHRPGSAITKSILWYLHKNHTEPMPNQQTSRATLVECQINNTMSESIHGQTQIDQNRCQINEHQSSYLPNRYAQSRSLSIQP